MISIKEDLIHHVEGRRRSVVGYVVERGDLVMIRQEENLVFVKVGFGAV